MPCHATVLLCSSEVRLHLCFTLSHCLSGFYRLMGWLLIHLILNFFPWLVPKFGISHVSRNKSATEGGQGGREVNYLPSFQCQIVKLFSLKTTQTLIFFFFPRNTEQYLETILSTWLGTSAPTYERNIMLDFMCLFLALQFLLIVDRFGCFLSVNYASPWLFSPPGLLWAWNVTRRHLLPVCYSTKKGTMTNKPKYEF